MTQPGAHQEAHPAQPEVGSPAATVAPVDNGAGRLDPLEDGCALDPRDARIAELEAQVQTLQDSSLRFAAEAQNARRRADEDVSKARKFALEGFAQELLPVLDSLEAGLAVEHATAEQIKIGAQATQRQLLAALERSHVHCLAPTVGEKFDPNLHQAISTVPDTGQECNTIVSVLQKGYSLSGRVLRPALVTVAQG